MLPTFELTHLAMTDLPFSPIARGTNRGNKLKRQAKHVWRGGLVSMSGADLPREVRMTHCTASDRPCELQC